MSNARDRRKRRADEPEASPAEAPVPPEETVPYWQDKALRAQAELVNMRRRAEQEIDERARLRTEGLLAEMIQVADSLELALAAAPETWQSEPAARPLLDGLRAIQSALAMLLARQGVEPIDAAPGAAFDPEQHEAVLVEDRPALAAPSVELLRRGYRAGRRILRPAQVRLLRPAASTETQSTD